MSQQTLDAIQTIGLFVLSLCAITDGILIFALYRRGKK